MSNYFKCELQEEGEDDMQFATMRDSFVTGSQYKIIRDLSKSQSSMSKKSKIKDSYFFTGDKRSVGT